MNEKMVKLGKERSVIREIFEYGNLRAQEIGRENVFDFSLGNPSVPAPDCVNVEIERLLSTMPAEKLHGYTSAAGASEVREAVAQYIQTQFGALMSADLVYMTCGAAASLTVTLNGILQAGDEVVVISPYFPEYKVFIEQAGGKMVAARANENFHLDLCALSKAIGNRTRAVIVNSPNNPTGAVYGEEEMKKLGDLLTQKSRERGEPVYLLADEPYRELCYVSRPVYPMKIYPNTIVCYSFSKSLSLAGERIGYIAVSPLCEEKEEIFAAILGAGRSLGYVCAPALFQRVVASALGKSGDIGKYRKNRDLLLNALEGLGFSCVPSEGAFYLFVKSPVRDAKEFCKAAKKYELLLVPSDSFGIEGYVRISYCVEREMIERALPAFEKLAKEYKLL